MFVEPDDKDTSALSHEGVTYEPDAKGRFEVPNEVGLWLATRPGWSVSEDTDPVEAPAPKAAPAKKPAAKATDTTK